jgi:hypothetical protein
MWPISHAAALLALRHAEPSKERPVPLSGGVDKPSWGPLTVDGILGMHYGDLFYGLLGLAVWYLSWPAEADAKVLPSLQGLAQGDLVGAAWIARVVVRNLLLLVPFYEFWHQLQFGALATEGVTAQRYSQSNPYEKRGGSKAQMNVWRERFWCTCGFIWSSGWECFIVHLWASGAIPACSNIQLGGGAGPLGLACQLRTPSLNDLSEFSASSAAFLAWFFLAFLLTTQFRGMHFFFVHRAMHPWWKFSNGLKDGDIGAFMYRWVHRCVRILHPRCLVHV